MGFRDYSRSAGSNTSVGGVSIAENMARSDVNNAIRAQLADARAFADGFGYSAIDYGFSATQTAAQNLASLNNAIADCNTDGVRLLMIPPGNYPLDGAVVIKSNVHIYGYGATLDGSGIYLYNAQGTSTSNWGVYGLTIDTDTAENFAMRLFDVSYFNIRDIRIIRSGSGGYTGMFIGASYGIVDGLTSTGSNGIWIEGHDLVFTNGNMTAQTGGDDCLVVKAPYISAGEPRTSSYNIAISNWNAVNFTAVVSLGSEVGKFNAADSTYSRYIRNVSISNVTGKGCQGLVFIKPGANSTNSYQDGTVENVSISNCAIEDVSGSLFQAGIFIWAGRGGRVKNVRINNVTMNIRALTQTAVTNAGIKIQGYDYTGGTAASRIEDVFINGVNIIDVYDGAPNGGSAPGYPNDYGVIIENQTGSGGTTPVIGRVEIKDIYINGTRRNAVAIGTGLTGPFKLNDATFKNFCHTGVAAVDRGAIEAQTKVLLRNIEATASASAPAGTRPIMSDNATSLSTEIACEHREIVLGDVATTTTTYRAFTAGERAVWIRKIEFVNRANIAASAVNKVTITVDNKDTGANLTTKDSDTGFAYGAAANNAVSIAGTNQFSGANSLLGKGETLDITIATAGTVALAGASLIVHYVPYGQF